MMDMPFTPGPWHWIDSSTDLAFRWDGANVGYPSLRTVATFGRSETIERNGKRYTSWALPKFILDADTLDNPADAKLIAAAPELLEALRALVDVTWGLEQATSSDGCYTYNPLEKMAREAIAKATK